MIRRMVCIVCPRGCQLQVEILEDDYAVSGNQCNRGIPYAVQEISDPVRILTTTIKTDNPEKPRIPVKLSKEIPLRQFPDYLNLINNFCLKRSCIPGDILCSSILADGGADLIATGAYDCDISVRNEHKASKGKTGDLNEG